MKKLVLSISFFCSICFAFAQMEDRIVLSNVGLDSLKKVIEQRTDYELYFVEGRDGLLLKLSLSWGRSDLIPNLNSALHQVGYSLSQNGNHLYVLRGVGIETNLPERYFSAIKGEQLQDSTIYAALRSSQENQEAGSANKVYIIGDPNAVFAGNRAVISGYVRSLESREPITGILVAVGSTGLMVSTDIHGFYRVSVPLGKVDLELKGYGYEDTPVMLEVHADGALDITVKERVYSLRSVVVSADANQQRRSTFVGVEKVSINRIRHIPAVFGEADVMKVVLTLPGVKTVGESSGGFNVRGGATDQNLVLFNEGTLFNPTHLFGLFSSFNPDVVSDIELYKSTIPAKYGGRISSVLEVNSRQGNNSKITGSAGIGLLTGKLHLEGPIIKDRTTFIAGGRTTYSNWILKSLPKSSGYRDGRANFSDITAGISHKINSTNSLHLYGYYSGDSFSFGKDTIYGYQSANLALRWHTLFNAKHNMTFTAGYDRYRHHIEESAIPEIAYDMRFGLDQFFAKINFEWFINEKHTLGYGINSTYFMISPGKMVPLGSGSIIAPDRVDEEKGWENALYVSDKWSFSRKFSIDLGLRYTLFTPWGSDTYHHGPEFRFSSRYMFENNLTVKAGFNTMRQNIHMLSNTAAASPIDIWKLSDANIVPQTGWQAAAGVYHAFFDSRWEVSLDGYYKSMNHYLDYKSGAVINMNKHIEEDVLETEGKAYGVEVMIKKPSGKLNGWLAYSYSKTMLRESGDKERFQINNGKWYPAVYDKPHDVKVVMNYKFTQRYSISSNLDYSSGRPVTVPISVYYYGGGYRLEYADRNKYRIPDYFRLDVAFNIEPSHNLTLWTYSVITFGVYNITGRKNAFSVYYSSSGGQKVQGYKLSVFGAPIPYINYTIKF